MFDIFYSGKKPGLFPHEMAARDIEHAKTLSRTRYFWWITYLADLNDWDFLWEPAPWQSGQRHAWPSQHQKDAGVYLVPKEWNGIDSNYHTLPRITRLVDYENWVTPEEVDISAWDYSWHPDYSESGYIYEFATEWHDVGGPVYTVPGATQKKHITDIKAKLTQRHDNHWHTLEDCEWDYSWRPHPQDPAYIYVFGNQWWPAEKWPTVEYHVPGATQRKYLDWPRATLLLNTSGWTNLTDHQYTFDYSWRPDPGDLPYRYVFGNQWWPAEKMPTVEWLHPDANESTPTKYVAWPRAELQPNKTLWNVPAGVDQSQIDFSWVPDPGEPPYIYQFATQHQKTGGPVYTVSGATEVKYLEHVEVKIESAAVPVVEIDHLDGNAGNIPGAVKKIRYFDNYRDTLIRLAKSLLGQHEFVWVCSSVCDYTEFDFSWYPEKWQSTMLHVFASNDQKFGDTFYMHVPTFAERAEKKALLEWYSVNFVPNKSVPRRPMPVIEHTGDSQVDAVKNTDWSGPLALFTTNGVPITLPTVSLWRQETKTVLPLSRGASSVIIPKHAKSSIKTQLYDYPYVDKTDNQRHGDRSLDIVFISNGEYSAEQNYGRLLDSTYNRNNRIHRVDGVKGRVAAYHAAAQASTTPWFFAVFAKLQVSMNFDWAWQPDRMQAPKHYIFHAENPVNGLIYGHQAMIAYNRDLVLANTGQGLDFTLDSAHEVVPIRSGTAYYADTPWMAWRTAFREAIKLKASLPDVESEYRLSRWLSSNANGESIANEDWSRWGAEDAVEYYDAVGGDFAELKKSYEWDWLASYAFVKRNLTPDH